MLNSNCKIIKKPNKTTPNMKKSKYYSPDYGLEECKVLFKGKDGGALILTKSKGKNAPLDCLIIAYWDRVEKCYVDKENWVNIKRDSLKKIKM